MSTRSFRFWSTTLTARHQSLALISAACRRVAMKQCSYLSMAFRAVYSTFRCICRCCIDHRCTSSDKYYSPRYLYQPPSGFPSKLRFHAKPRSFASPILGKPLEMSNPQSSPLHLPSRHVDAVVVVLPVLSIERRARCCRVQRNKLSLTQTTPTQPLSRSSSSFLPLIPCSATLLTPTRFNLGSFFIYCPTLLILSKQNDASAS